MNRPQIVEVSLGRIYKHFTDTGFAMLSADKWNLSDEENDERYEQLKADVKAAGYGYVPVLGKYTYQDDEGGKKVASEDSLFIPDKPREEGADPLDDVLRELGIKWDQETVLIGHPGGHVELIDPTTGDVDMSFDAFDVKDVADAWSQLRTGGKSQRAKKFVFERWIAVIPNPRSFGEAVKMAGSGLIRDPKTFLTQRPKSEVDRAVDRVLG